MISVKDLAGFVGTGFDNCCRLLTAIAEVPTESDPRTVSEPAAKQFLIYWTLTHAGISADYAGTISKMAMGCLDGATGVIIADGRYVITGPEDRVFDLISSKYINRTDKPTVITMVFGPEIWKRFEQGLKS